MKLAHEIVNEDFHIIEYPYYRMPHILDKGYNCSLLYFLFICNIYCSTINNNNNSNNNDKTYRVFCKFLPCQLYLFPNKHQYCNIIVYSIVFKLFFVYFCRVVN